MMRFTPPVDDEEVSVLWQRQLNEPVPPLTTVAPELARAAPCDQLDEVLAVLMAKRPEDRYESALAASQALQKLDWSR